LKKTTQFHIRPARPEEAGLFYAQHPEEDKRLGAVGCVRMDFGRSENKFCHTWWTRGQPCVHGRTATADGVVLRDRSAGQRQGRESRGCILLSTSRWFPAILKKKNYLRRTSAMKKILFVCLGNICRSPMAEFVMKDLVKKAGLASQFHIESAATSREEIGNPVYPPARRKLSEHGISCGGHAARQLTKRDYDEYDLLIGMDSANLRNMQRICGGDPDGKLHLLMDYTDHPRDAADPWYTGDFELTWQDVLAGCQGLLKELAYDKT